MTLIGMPGSGKSAVGKIIASRLGWNFIDTDKRIEKLHGMPLQALIDQVGDDAFRAIEEQSILDLETMEQVVISTGGSVVYSDAAMRHLASMSTVVFLDASMEAISAHVASEAPRGIVGMVQGGLEELYLARLPRYRHYATLIIPLTVETPEEAANQVLSELRKDRQTGDIH
jgi:shikimate kinase